MSGPAAAPAAPRVTVIVPTYNRVGMVGEAVDSVLAQAFRDFRIILVDDGSTDGTGAMVRERYGEDPRVRYVYQENGGISAARNRGIAESASEYVAFLDSDDRWLPEKLARQVPALDAHPDAALCFTDARYDGGAHDGITDFARRRFDGDTSLRALLLNNFIVTPSTVVARRALLPASRPFTEELHVAEDWECWVRTRARHPFLCLPDPLTIYRVHPGNAIRLQPYSAQVQIKTALMREFEPRFVAGGGARTQLRRRVAILNKNAARGELAAGRFPAARRHLLAWWRARPWSLRPLGAWLWSFPAGWAAPAPGRTERAEP